MRLVGFWKWVCNSEWICVCVNVVWWKPLEGGRGKFCHSFKQILSSQGLPYFFWIRVWKGHITSHTFNSFEIIVNIDAEPRNHGVQWERHDRGRQINQRYQRWSSNPESANQIQRQIKNTRGTKRTRDIDRWRCREARKERVGEEEEREGRSEWEGG